MALYFNCLEMALFALFERYTQGGPAARALLFAELSNDARVKVVRAIANQQESAAVAEEVDYALTCFRECVANRNLVLHSLPTAEEGDRITVAKAPRKGPPGHLRVYEFTLEALRAAASSVADIESHILLLVDWLSKVENAEAEGAPRPSPPQRPAVPPSLNLLTREAPLTPI
ncbi:hypothetical protein [Phenylobacterium sp.]|uniref:hypothetical protein n=1 Tax=Phenylobacterium sp. TaxID=1871053 RepID=UPI003918A79D